MLIYKKAEALTEAFSVETDRYSICALLKLKDTKKQRALLTGKLITLFDAPNRLSSDIDSLFDYYISAELEGRNKTAVPIVVSFDRDGIWIAAPRGFTEKGALLGLVMRLRSTIPAAYEIKCRNERIKADITMGVKNGLPYFETLCNRP
ncbi:MAG: hypothetical protein NC394_02205 [Bacteroides sp.]|nr:hypothetical protein [Bacteroides sp.]